MSCLRSRAAYWDQKRLAEAERLARRGRKEFPEQTEWVKLVALIAGEAAEQSGNLFAALQEYGEARRQLPTTRTSTPPRRVCWRVSECRMRQPR